MSSITLRKAVELLHKGGDSIDVAVTRLRAAATAGKVRSWGLTIGRELCGSDNELFETEKVNAYKYYQAWNYGKIDWEHSTIEIPEVCAHDDEDGCHYMYLRRIVLNLDDFDRVFFPDKVTPSKPVEQEKPAERQPPIALSQVKAWLDREYEGKSRPRVHDLRAAAKAHDRRITRSLLERAAAEKWPEPRRRGRPSSENKVPEKSAGKVQG